VCLLVEYGLGQVRKPVHALHEVVHLVVLVLPRGLLEARELR
jgi:hypothetical protein